MGEMFSTAMPKTKSTDLSAAILLKVLRICSF